MEDGSVEDGRRKTGGRTPALAVGAGLWGRQDGLDWLASQASGAALLCVGGGGIPRWISWLPGRVGVSGPRKAPAVCVLTDPSPPLPRPSSSPRASTAAFPSAAVWDRAGLASRSVVPPPPSTRSRPEQSSALKALRKGAGRGPGTAGLRDVRALGNRRYAAGRERFSWPAAALSE